MEGCDLGVDVLEGLDELVVDVNAATIEEGAKLATVVQCVVTGTVQR